MEMDIRKLCFHCFQEKANPAGVCPHCGFDPAAQTQFPMALPMGSILAGRYIVGRVLGQGGFGITYVALDVKQKIRVAVKEYMPETMATRQTGTQQVTAFSGGQSDNFAYGKEQFLEEARTLAKFAGVNGVVSVHTYFEENGTAYFVMEYVEGTSFKRLIKQSGGRVSWSVARSVLIPVIDALDAVHRAGIIHRDVTPDNIYINSEGAVKLLDFGAARYSMGDRSRSLDVVLKAGYAPKEQYVRRGRQGPYTDVYSVAASFYASVTGYLPPESLERMEEDDLVPPSNRGVNLPAEAEAAIEKGLAVRAEDRFQTMGEFKEALMAADPTPLLPIFPGARPPMEAAAHPVQQQPINFTSVRVPVQQAVQQAVQQPVQRPVPPPVMQQPMPMPQINVQQPAQQPTTVVQTPGANVSVSYVNMQPPVQQVQVQQPAQMPVQQPVQQEPRVAYGAGPVAPPKKKSNVGLFVGLGVGVGLILLVLGVLLFFLLGGGGRKVPSAPPTGTTSSIGTYIPPMNSQPYSEDSNVIEFDNGDRYEGDMVTGIPHGEGVYTWAEGCSFEGSFEDGHPSGEGTFTYVDGSTKTASNWSHANRDEYTYTSGDYEGQLACYYTGMMIDNRAYGYGSFEWTEDDPFCPGWTYTGEMNEDDANGHGTIEFDKDGLAGTYMGTVSACYPTGAGTYTYADGHTKTSSNWTWETTVSLSYYTTTTEASSGNADEFISTMDYEGMYCDDSAFGYGIMRCYDGGVFYGEFENTCVSGAGRYVTFLGETISGKNWSEVMTVNGYSGMELDGLSAGFGIYIWDDGEEWYRGEFLNDDRNGFGIYHWLDGDEYIGEWVDNDRTGFGIYTWADTGDTYEGDFVAGVRTGFGTMTYGDSGTVYEGDFVDGKYEGYGVMTWTNGDRYEGDYVDGKRHGQGTYTWGDGEWKGDQYIGEWVNGERTGYGKYIYANGTVEEGQFDNGKFVG